MDTQPHPHKYLLLGKWKGRVDGEIVPSGLSSVRGWDQRVNSSQKPSSLCAGMGLWSSGRRIISRRAPFDTWSGRHVKHISYLPLHLVR